MFDPDLAGTFKLFSLSHLTAAFIIFVIIALIIINRVRIRESIYFNAFRITLAILILAQEVILNIYRIVLDEWQISTSLPLQLCGLGVLTTAIVLLTKSEKLFINTFFIMMIGATMAIITPGIENQLGFPHFRFFQFFISHGLIVINFTFILFVLNFQEAVRYRHLLNNFVVLAGIAVILLGVNLLTGGNYMYLMAKPGPNTAFDLFGEHPWYLLNIFIFGIPIFFHLFYFPFFVRNYHLKKRALLS
jgi:hypothetical integral membrane protein (TIGR02206 family)